MEGASTTAFASASGCRGPLVLPLPLPLGPLFLSLSVGGGGICLWVDGVSVLPLGGGSLCLCLSVEGASAFASAYLFYFLNFIFFLTHLYCLVGCLSMLVWVSYMHVFCIFVVAPLQRN